MKTSRSSIRASDRVLRGVRAAADVAAWRRVVAMSFTVVAVLGLLPAFVLLPFAIERLRTGTTLLSGDPPLCTDFCYLPIVAFAGAIATTAVALWLYRAIAAADELGSPVRRSRWLVGMSLMPIVGFGFAPLVLRTVWRGGAPLSPPTNAHTLRGVAGVVAVFAGWLVLTRAYDVESFAFHVATAADAGVRAFGDGDPLLGVLHLGSFAFLTSPLLCLSWVPWFACVQAVQGSAAAFVSFGPFPWASAPSAVAETWIRIAVAGIAILLWLRWTRLVTERLRARAVEIETLAAPIGTPDDD